MTNVHVVVLAAGLGRRMHSRLPKVLHLAAGLPLLEHVLRTAEAVSPESITVVIGHGAEVVRAKMADRRSLRFALQEQQLGTAHALQQAEPLLRGKRGVLVVLSGDVPLLSVATLRQLLERHQATRASATLVTSVLEQPAGYGRIIRSNGLLSRIVEDRDASPTERQVREINGGIYAFDIAPLFGALADIAAHNAQGEHYLTDLVGVYRGRGLRVETVVVGSQEIRGVNSREELAEVSSIVRQKKNEELMAAGVTIVDPSATYIDPDVSIGPDTVIHPGVILEGKTRVGSACEIHAYVRILDSVIGDDVTINSYSLLNGAQVGRGVSVGPFAHLRPESVLGEGARVGNFVELKKTTLGPGSKANHLSYLGDATVGAHVNVGAGTITCNYDGAQKHQTVIEDGAFIGSDSQLIAPVRIGRGAYVGAGSSISEDVPDGALGIARSQQRNIEGWVERKTRS